MLFNNLSNYLLFIKFRFIEFRQSIEKELVCHIRVIFSTIHYLLNYLIKLIDNIMNKNYLLKNNNNLSYLLKRSPIFFAYAK